MGKHDKWREDGYYKRKSLMPRRSMFGWYQCNDSHRKIGQLADQLAVINSGSVSITFHFIHQASLLFSNSLTLK
jgi:hypothetical protein